MVRRRAIRDVPPLPASAALIRALFEVYDHGDYDRDVLIADATYNFEEFGYYGSSFWIVDGAWTLDRLMSTTKLPRAARFALYSVGDLTGHDLRLVASGREPHYDATDGVVLAGASGSVRITAGSAAQLVDRFLATPYTLHKNPHFVQNLR